jgi:predicted MFS family arabinose efflux permease
VKESLPVEKRKVVPIKELFQNPLVPLKFLYTSRYLRALTAVSFCLTLPFDIVMSINLYYLEDRIKGFGPSDNALFMTSAGVSYILLSYTALPLGLKILSPPTLICIASFISVINNVAPLLVREKWQVFALLGPSAGMSFFIIPIVTQLVTTTLKPNEQGLALGTMAAVNGLANSIGPLMGAGAYSLGKKYLGFGGLPFCIGAAVAVAGVFVAFFLVRPVVKEMEDLVTLGDENDSEAKTAREPSQHTTNGSISVNREQESLINS